MQRWRAEVVLEAGAALGEGPIWSVAEQVLYWLDIEAHAVHRFDPATASDDSVDVGEMPGALGLRRSGGAWPFRPSPLAAVDDDRPELRMNDGACDSRGRFWAGTMRLDASGAEAALHRLDPTGEVTSMLDGVGISNGIAWSPEDTLMYYVDTPTHAVDVFDFDADGGTIANRRRLIEVDPADGDPDGLVCDSEGCLWLALWKGSSVRRYSPSGDLIGVVELPVSRVTKCAFGGPALDDLYITTAGSRDTREPHAGALFHAATGVRGCLPNLFAG
jgi:sugar lactone lactonase YvrE